MGSNFQRCTFLGTGAGDLEPRRRLIVAGHSLLESGAQKVILGVVGGAHVARADVVVHYEIMNFDVPRSGIQGFWYRPCKLDSVRAQRARSFLFK